MRKKLVSCILAAAMIFTYDTSSMAMEMGVVNSISEELSIPEENFVVNDLSMEETELFCNEFSTEQTEFFESNADIEEMEGFSESDPSTIAEMEKSSENSTEKEEIEKSSESDNEVAGNELGETDEDEIIFDNSALSETNQEMSESSVEENDVDLEGIMPVANSGIYSASSIKTNYSYTDNLMDDRDENWYKFTISKPGYIQLDFQHGYIESSYTYWKAYLYTSAQGELASYGFTGKSTVGSGGNIGLPAGTYYLKITSYYYSNKYYTFKVNYTVSSIWEREFNDSYSTANTINVNNTYCGSLCNDDDVDWFKFSVANAGYISLNFSHEHIESDYVYWKVYLYNGNQAELTYYDFRGTGIAFYCANIGVPAGTYYVKVVDYNYSSADYKIKMNYTSSSIWETEFNEEYSTADTINVNNTYYGSLMHVDDVDWYSFTLPEAGYISLNFSHDYMESGNVYWQAYLYKADMRTLTSYYFYGSTISETCGNIGLPEGTYYLKIINYNYHYYNGWDYNFKINYTASKTWEKEFNDSYDIADLIEANKNYYGSLMNDHDVDWYKFTVSAQGTKILYFNHDYKESSNVYWRLYLYDPTMKQIASYSFSGNKTTSSAELNLQSGTYYIKIIDYYYSSLNYSFRINDHFKLSPVKNLKAVPYGKKRVLITWNPVDGADGYIIYSQKNSKYGYLGTTYQNYYIDKNALDTGYNYYWVFPFTYTANGTIDTCNSSSYVWAQGIIPMVTGFKGNSAKGAVQLTWNSKSVEEGADGYLIYGKTGSGVYHYIGMTVGRTATSFKDTKASATNWNFYWVFPFHYGANKKIIPGTISSNYVYGKRR